MLDHFGITVPASRFEEILEFYTLALEPIGYSKQVDIPGRAVGFGPEPGIPFFWIACEQPGQTHSAGISRGTLPDVAESPKGNGLHLAFKAKSHDVVRSFHAAAIKAGAKDNGKPEIKTQYHPNYFGAFVIDPLGNNLEVVDHSPEASD